MPVFNVFLLVLCAQWAFGQNVPAQKLLLDIQKPKEITWSALEKTYTPAYTKRVLQNSEFDNSCGKRNSGAPNTENYHWIDLNADGADDLIYSGTCQPYSKTEIYLLVDGRYRQVFQGNGIVSGINSGADATTVQVYAEACCCSQYNSLRYLQIPKSGETAALATCIYWHTDLKLVKPAFYNKITTPHQINVRTAPEWNNRITPSECNSDGRLYGNIVARFRPGTAITALAKKVNNDESWYFVLVEPNTTRVRDAFEGQPNEFGKTYSLGWISGQEVDPE